MKMNRLNTIKLKCEFEFISGHLLQDVSSNKSYNALSNSQFGIKIKDDKGNVILLSNTCLSKYFTKG